MDFQELIRETSSQGVVLLRNENETLPFTNSDKISIFGRCQIDYYKSGTGSGGSVHAPFSVNLIDGLENLKKENFSIPEINENLVEFYKEWIKDNPFDTGNGGWACEPWCQKELELSEVTVALASRKSDKAVFVIGRTAGEDQDNKAEKGSFFLTDTEYENIKKLCRYFRSVTIILNVPNIIDLSWVDNADLNGKIKAILYSWQGGMQGGQGLADVLCGKTSPSGKLVDTIAYKLSDYPSSKNFGSATDEIYEEDIFIGYRYFSTFANEKVQYPFGFGLSYTTFDIKTVNYQINELNSKLFIEVKVTNTGNFAGKEVVQVYAKCPQGKLGKSERILCGFAKTKELTPLEAENLKIEIDYYTLASYDDSGLTDYPHSYVLEEGTYSLFVGNSSFTETKIFTSDNKEFELSQTLLIEKLSQNCAPQIEFDRLRPIIKKDGTYEMFFEKVPVSDENLEEKIRINLPTEIKETSSNPIKFGDVIKDKSLVDAFITGLTENELCTLVRGEGMMSRKVTTGIASAFGGISESLHEKGIPAVGCSDGPSGIRFDNGKESTLIPIGTLLACTWNPLLIEELYKNLGNEMIDKNIDVLLGPGCNIHRNPLNGRNFEYFSEDPFISGIMAISVCKGLSYSGAIGTLKHLTLNNQETHRRTENSVV